jgi:hypothetical protein
MEQHLEELLGQERTRRLLRYAADSRRSFVALLRMGCDLVLPAHEKDPSAVARGKTTQARLDHQARLAIAKAGGQKKWENYRAKKKSGG